MTYMIYSGIGQLTITDIKKSEAIEAAEKTHIIDSRISHILYKKVSTLSAIIALGSLNQMPVHVILPI